MASNGENSSATPQSTDDKPVIVRVKRKVSQSRLDAFWPGSADATTGNAKSQKGRHPHKTDNQREQLSKSIQKQEEIAKNDCFEQIWRSRRGKKEAVDDMYHFYDVVRVDVEESSNSMQAEDYLPLLRECIPAAAAEIESDMRAYMYERDEYVYDYYTVKDDMDIDEDTASNPFPLVQVDDEDFYDVPYESEYDSEDSNAEDNPRNDYPDEISEEEEDEDAKSRASDQSEEGSEHTSNKSSEVGDVRCDRLVEDGDLLYEDDIYDGYHDDANHIRDGNSDDDTEGEDWRWSYR
ncbi:RNA-directed DNA methylation 4, putative isoform 4 [Theobroma cacao]|uniref:RNA-directed DNA methylation 4, putative isoform 4 n=1 Tax=Theobroma cacao TaxID=3641 RepID=A0A061GYS5_THECC|nr:RNA-directed DNA methylation 4, putative isoform 4 [Theobroma cacao]